MRQYLLETNGQSDVSYIFLEISRQRSDIYWLPYDTGHAVDFIVDENMLWFFPSKQGRPRLKSESREIYLMNTLPYLTLPYAWCYQPANSEDHQEFSYVELLYLL